MFLLLGLPQLLEFLLLLITDSLPRDIMRGKPLLIKPAKLVCLRAEHFPRRDCCLGITLTLQRIKGGRGGVEGGGEGRGGRREGGGREGGGREGGGSEGGGREGVMREGGGREGIHQVRDRREVGNHSP